MTQSTLPSETIAYVAGVIDARAYIRAEARRGRPEPRIRVTTRRIELLDYLANLTGTKVRIDNAGYERRPCSEHCKQHHQHMVRQSANFNIDSTRATIVLHNIQPYIINQKEAVRDALKIGLRWFPPSTGAAVEEMRKRGWAIPVGENQPKDKPLPPHGTPARYAQGCHCAECRAANAARARKNRKERKEKHDTAEVVPRRTL